MNAKVLHLLLAGEYICDYAHRTEWEILQDVTQQDEIKAWLLPLGMRLARLGDEGAFFMAYDNLGPKEITRVKGEFAKFRDEYGPAVLFLDFVRQADTSRSQLAPGELIILHVLEAAVNQSSTLESQLKGLLGVIAHGNPRNSNHENLRRLLDHLASDGYAILSNREQGSYRITGKIDQLYAALQFLDENKVIPDSEVDDSEEDTEDLVDEAGREEAAP